MTENVHNDWDLRSEEVQKDQVAAYDAMRRRCPVAHDEFMGYSVFKKRRRTARTRPPRNLLQRRLHPPHRRPQRHGRPCAHRVPRNQRQVLHPRAPRKVRTRHPRSRAGPHRGPSSRRRSRRHAGLRSGLRNARAERLHGLACMPRAAPHRVDREEPRGHPAP